MVTSQRKTSKSWLNQTIDLDDREKDPAHKRIFLTWASKGSDHPLAFYELKCLGRHKFRTFLKMWIFESYHTPHNLEWK